MVLDEATNALDAETERAVSQTLVEMEGDVRLVVVAHSLATIRHCDLVVFLEGGCLAAVWSFDDVRKQAPNFDRQAQLFGL
jgi:ABC-type bacteriocin/lantibiotic exporter with double-glycine peptidase domain